MLSSSISVAMNTTAFGLISAIPLLLLHAVLQTKTTEIVDSFEMASVKVAQYPGRCRRVAQPNPRSGAKHRLVFL